MGIPDFTRLEVFKSNSLEITLGINKTFLYMDAHPISIPKITTNIHYIKVLFWITYSSDYFQPPIAGEENIMARSHWMQ